MRGNNQNKKISRSYNRAFTEKHDETGLVRNRFYFCRCVVAINAKVAVCVWSQRKRRQKKNNKPRVDYEPRSAHGRAVNKSTQRRTKTWVKVFDLWRADRSEVRKLEA